MRFPIELSARLLHDLLTRLLPCTHSHFTLIVCWLKSVHHDCPNWHVLIHRCATEIHRQYKELFEQCLIATAADAGMSEVAFAEQLADALEVDVLPTAESLAADAAEVILSHAHAAYEYSSFSALCRCRHKQLRQSGSTGRGHAPSAGQSEELRALLWGLQLRGELTANPATASPALGSSLGALDGAPDGAPDGTSLGASLGAGVGFHHSPPLQLRGREDEVAARMKEKGSIECRCQLSTGHGTLPSSTGAMVNVAAAETVAATAAATVAAAAAAERVAVAERAAAAVMAAAMAAEQAAATERAAAAVAVAAAERAAEQAAGLQRAAGVQRTAEAAAAAAAATEQAAAVMQRATVADPVATAKQLAAVERAVVTEKAVIAVTDRKSVV